MAKKRYVVVTSAFDSKGRCICTRENSYTKTHPIQKHFAKLAGEPYKEFLHSEIHCLIASKMQAVDKIVVMRYDCFGNLQNAKPCKTCHTALKAYGVKNVYYSTEEGLIKYEQ